MSGSSSRRLASTILGALLTLALIPAGALAAPLVAFAITSSAASTFTIGMAGTFTVTTTGTPVPVITETGALPGGVTFADNGNGTATLAGTPAAATNGSYPITITAADGHAFYATQDFTLTVNGSPNITSGPAATFTVGVPGAFTVTTTGSPTSAITEAGPLPSGLTFADNHDGTASLAGTPAAAANGTYPLTITADNGTTNAVQNFTLTVNPDVAAQFTSASSTTFTLGAAGTFTVATSGGTPTPGISITAGSLPGGVTLVDNHDGTATLSGTPAAGGTYPVTIAASNVAGSPTQSFTLTVNSAAAPTITSGGNATFTEGAFGSVTVITTGTPLPAIAISGGSLPSGLSFVDNGDGTATISGTPAVGTSLSSPFVFTIQASNTAGSPTQTFVLTVNPSGQSLVFATQPGGAAAGAVWTQQPVVEVVNSMNQVVTTDNSTVVYLTIGTNPVGGTLACTGGTSATVINGIATFSGCSIDVASSSPYTLSASSSPSWTPATSGAFYVAGSESLVFATQPGGAAAGAVWTQQPVVEVVNSMNQVVTTDNSTVVYLTIGTNPVGGTLACTGGTSATVINGIATFSGCSIDVASSSPYTLSASSSPSWTPATSGAFYTTGIAAPDVLSATSAVGANSSSATFTTSTKLLKVGKSITIRVESNPQLAGATMGVWIAVKGSNGTWGAYKPHTSVTTDASGTAYYTYTIGSRAWLAFRFYYAGSQTVAPAWSYPSQFGRAL